MSLRINLRRHALRNECKEEKKMLEFSVFANKFAMYLLNFILITGCVISSLVFAFFSGEIFKDMIVDLRKERYKAFFMEIGIAITCIAISFTVLDGAFTLIRKMLS